MAGGLNRRQFFALAAAGLGWPGGRAGFAETIPIVYRKPDPLAPERALIDPAAGGFALEAAAARIEEALRSMQGEGRDVQFYSLADGLVRYEIRSGAEYVTGVGRVRWEGERVAGFEPVEETRAHSERPWFAEITGHLFGVSESFRSQLCRGVPYWRARLDTASGIDVYGNNGVAVGDIDSDGWDEIYVCQPGGLPNRLYRRGKDGRFEDITDAAGVGVLDDTASALFLDLRNSGRQDLVVLTTSGPLLFLNEGGSRFRYAPDAFRFATPPSGTFTGMAAADYDRDGFVDLYLCTYIYFQGEEQYRYPVPYHDARNGPPNFLFRNRLNEGYFDDVTAATGLSENNNRYSFAPAWCDYDGDGWPDLYVANDFGRNNLYRNEGGHFRDVAEEAGVVDVGPGMSSAWFDYDGDGRPDLYVANMWTAPGQRVGADSKFAPVTRDGLREEYRRHAKGNSLYRNRGDGGFAETGAREGVEMGRWAWSADGVDFDNDGVPEIYVTCGMLTGDKGPDLNSYFWRRTVAESPARAEQSPGYERGWNSINQWIREGYSWSGDERNVFYVRREGRYRDYSGVSGIDVAGDSRAFAVTDLDGDGALDLIVKTRLGPQLRVFQNQAAGGRHSIGLLLRGVRSNQDAIGAKVEVTHEGGTVTRWVSAGSGYLSQHTKQVIVGLGESRRAERVRIVWPSGEVQEIRQLAAGFRYRITEGKDEIERVAFASARRLDAKTLPGDDRPGLADTWLLEPLPSPVTLEGSGPRVVRLTSEALKNAPAEMTSAWAIFRRYLFDYRADLELPLAFLVDERGLIHKIYGGVPGAEAERADVTLLRRRDREALALPFRGEYHHPPGRNLYRFAAAFLGAGYARAALPYLDELLARSPGNPKALLAAGQIQLDLGNVAEARQHLERAIALNPKQAEAHNALGGVHMSEARYREAAEAFGRALELQPKAAYAMANLAQAEARLGNAARAEELFQAALAADPDDADAANQLGLLLARQGRNDEARRSFQQALTIRKDHSGAINNLGVLYMKLGQRNDALAAFLYGTRVNPDDETICLNLARLYVQSGERARARAVLEEFVTRRPGSETVRRALRELDQ